MIRNRPNRAVRVAVAVVVGTATLAASVSVAAAAPPPPAGTITDIADGLIGPLQIHAGRSGSVYVAEAFSGTLRWIDRSGSVSDPIAVNPTGEIGGVSAQGNRIAYVTNDRDPDTFDATASEFVVLKKGDELLRVDLLAFEQNENPDQINTYGFESISPVCADQLPEFLGPPSYDGIIDSHPYAIANAENGWYVAEAGGNAILHVSRTAAVATVAVLPPQPFVVTAQAAAAQGLPPCAVGLTYNFEPVPTDVEVGDDGMLYVTTLPGGPEDPSLGARGSVYRVDPSTGTAELVATGFLGAVNVAIGGGQIYVSEMFANKISMVAPGGSAVVAELATPAGLEWARGRLYVSYNVFANGTVATISLH